MSNRRGATVKEPKSNPTKRLRFDEMTKRANTSNPPSRVEPHVLRQERKASTKRNMVDLGRLTSSEFNAILNGNDLEAEKEAKSAKIQKKCGALLKKDALNSLNEDVVQSNNINAAEESDGGSNNTPEEAQAKSSPNSPIPMQHEEDDNNNKGLNEDIVQNETKVSVEVQTNAVFVYCGCLQCCGLLLGVVRSAEDFRLSGGCCNKSLNHEPLVPCSSSGVTDQNPTNTTLQVSSSVSALDCSNTPFIKDQEDEMVSLVKGSKVKVSVTKKSNLKLKVTDGDPQKYVNALLDIFYSRKQQAVMTADGRTKGSTKLDPDISDAMQAYINHRYNSDKFNFSGSLFKDWVNQKCYSARRKEWADNPEMLSVRPKQPKKFKSPEQEIVIEDQNSRNSSSHGNNEKLEHKSAKLQAQVKSKSKFKTVEQPPPLKRPTTGGKRPKYMLVEASTGKIANVPMNKEFHSPAKRSFERILATSPSFKSKHLHSNSGKKCFSNPKSSSTPKSSTKCHPAKEQDDRSDDNQDNSTHQSESSHQSYNLSEESD